MQRTRRGHEWVPSHAPATKARAIAGHKQCERPGRRVHDDGVRHAFRAHQRAQPVKEQARAGHQQHRDDLATHHRRCDADPRYGAHGHQHQYERHQGRAKRDHELIDEYGWCRRTVNALCGVRRRSWRTLRHGVAVDNERRGQEQDQHDAGEDRDQRPIEPSPRPVRVGTRGARGRAPLQRTHDATCLPRSTGGEEADDSEVTFQAQLNATSCCPKLRCEAATRLQPNGKRQNRHHDGQPIHDASTTRWRPRPASSHAPWTSRPAQPPRPAPMRLCVAPLMSCAQELPPRCANRPHTIKVSACSNTAIR